MQHHMHASSTGINSGNFLNFAAWVDSTCPNPLISNEIPKCDSTLCDSNFAATSPQQDLQTANRIVLIESDLKVAGSSPISVIFHG